MVDVARDTEGVRMALAEIFEQEHSRARLLRSVENANKEMRERLFSTLPVLKLSPGYYRWAEHLIRLDDARQIGIGYTAASLAAFEAAGLVTLDRARKDFNFKHPECSACKARQDSRFETKCHACGGTFTKRKA